HPCSLYLISFFFQAEDGIRHATVTGVQTCSLPISLRASGLCPLCGTGGPSAVVLMRSNVGPGPSGLRSKLRWPWLVPLVAEIHEIGRALCREIEWKWLYGLWGIRK